MMLQDKVEKEGHNMEIAIIADDKKKDLMAQFCIAYCGILSQHTICASSSTAKFITDATGLHIECFLSGDIEGAQQILSRVSMDEIDLLLFFRDTSPDILDREVENNLLRLCDIHSVPVATNIATAEILVRALERGDLAWRDAMNPISGLNRKNRRKV